MPSIRVEDELPKAAVDFLKHCCKFVFEDWQHENREDLPDQGFERKFRASCVTQFRDWDFSQEREMGLGLGLATASGVLHEIDIVARHAEVTAIMELKNRQGPPGKNDIVVFFAKILDYLTLNPDLLLKEICPVFLSTSSFETTSLEACVGLGIHPIAPGLRPVPVLVDFAKRIDFEIRTGVQISEGTSDSFEDFCAELNTICLGLRDNWISSRFGRNSEDTIVMKAAGGNDSQQLGDKLRQLSADCQGLLSAVREAKR